MNGINVVSVSDNRDIRRGWRVRVFFLPDDLNARGHTLAERHFRAEGPARQWAAAMARTHHAIMQG